MNRWQSIISAIISAICVFGIPWLNRNGIIIDETAVTTIVASVVAAAAFVWTAWKNHNLTQAAMGAQEVLNELKIEYKEESKLEEDLETEEIEEIEITDEDEK